MSRREVLSLYKRLLRTLNVVFEGDHSALAKGTNKLKMDFKANSEVKSESSIRELIKHGLDCDKIFREHVVQGELNELSGNYKMKIREETYRFENHIFKADIKDEQYRKSRRAKKCSDIDKT